MDFKAMLLLLASLLSVITKVSSNYDPHDHQELKIKDQSELHSLFSVWLYPRIPRRNPIIRAPDPPSPPPLNEPAPTVVMPLTTNAAAEEAPSSTPQVKTPGDCVPLCEVRCKVETNKKICRRSCMACCDRCKCVPPGDYGSNLDACGKCYTDTTYHGHKCP